MLNKPKGTEDHRCVVVANSSKYKLTQESLELTKNEALILVMNHWLKKIIPCHQYLEFMSQLFIIIQLPSFQGLVFQSILTDVLLQFAEQLFHHFKTHFMLDQSLMKDKLSYYFQVSFRTFSVISRKNTTLRGRKLLHLDAFEQVFFRLIVWCFHIVVGCKLPETTLGSF